MLEIETCVWHKTTGEHAGKGRKGDGDDSDSGERKKEEKWATHLQKRVNWEGESRKRESECKKEVCEHLPERGHVQWMQHGTLSFGVRPSLHSLCIYCAPIIVPVLHLLLHLSYAHYCAHLVPVIASVVCPSLCPSCVHPLIVVLSCACSCVHCCVCGGSLHPLCTHCCVHCCACCYVHHARCHVLSRSSVLG